MAFLLLPVKLMAEDVIKLGMFNQDAAFIAANKKGFLKQENIGVEINTVTDSPTLLRNLISGKYDLILNNADNVIAWAEGQGEDPQKNDFIIFLGGSQGVDQKLIVAPGINDYQDLKGKIFAVDAPTTGYAVVGVAIMKKYGLEWNRDYTMKSFGNTTARANAMSRGDASGAMMSLPTRISKSAASKFSPRPKTTSSTTPAASAPRAECGLTPTKISSCASLAP